MRRKISLLLAFLLVVLSIGVAGCAREERSADVGAAPVQPVEGPPVRVGTFLDSEGALLGSMIIQMLEANGIQAVDNTRLGTPDVVRKALLEGEIDLQVDYTGSGQFYHAGEEGKDLWSDAALGLARIRELDREVNNLWWLTPANANNTELIATTREFAEANGLVTMEDFAEFINGGGQAKLIGAREWMDSSKGLAGFEEAYGFRMQPDQLIGLSHGVTAEMLKALAEGTDGVNFSLTYGTDGQLEDFGLVVLTDTKGVPPVYLPTPVASNEIMEAYPQIESILAPVFESLSLEGLQQLNRRVALAGEDAAAVAREYLKENGFIGQ